MAEMHVTEINELLDVAIETARKYEGTLGRTRKGKAQKALEAMRNSTLSLSNPEPFAVRLSQKRFAASGLTLSLDIEKSMQAGSDYVHYLLPSPVLLHPERGAQYRLLECTFKITAKGDRAPGIVRVFPEPRFKPVLSLGSSFTLQMDMGLDWGIELKQTDLDLKRFKGDLGGRVGNQNELVGFIKVLPFEYTLGRKEVEAQHSDDTAIWRFDGKDSIRKDGNVCLAMLVRVPRDIRQLTIDADAQAEVSFNWFSANIEHVLDRLPQFFIKKVREERRGPPLPVHNHWTISLPEDL